MPPSPCCKIGVDTGGSNVQFGINLKTGRVVVIEMNPRVAFLGAGVQAPPASRSPGRRQAGRGLHPRRTEERDHRWPDPGPFEPSIDYVVTKIRASPSRSSRPLMPA